MWRNPGEVPNGIDDDGNGYVDDVYGIDCITGDGDPFDDNGHGTSVAGTLGAVGNNGLGITGVAWNVRMMALKFLPASGPGYVSDAIECLDYATGMRARGVDIRVTNNSWSGGGYSSALRAAFERASAAGLLSVIAAGNGGRNLDAIPSFPACYEVDGLLSVAAYDGSGLLPDSNYGNFSVDLAAPGAEILSAAPGGGYGVFTGTSSAAPYAAGAAVLAWTAHPEASARAIKTLLLASARPLASLQGKTVSGGLLDAAAAVTRPLVLDSDGDGIPDTTDNCPWYPTRDTSDADRDGVGDACSCGDENLDRVVDVRDLVALNEVIFNRRAPGILCDANGDGVCDVADSPPIYQRIFGRPAYCSRYPKPRP
jgi:subtilisin family serine protease